MRWMSGRLFISDRPWIPCPANGVALLEHSDRVSQINILNVPCSHFLKTILETMQKPFPELTDLVLWSYHITSSVVPDSFLGGMPHVYRNSFFSTTHLVELYLWSIPHSGYISPETMANVFSALTSLGSLHFQFIYPSISP